MQRVPKAATNKFQKQSNRIHIYNTYLVPHLLFSLLTFMMNKLKGMILEATKTVTGFPPDSLLMTSA